MRIDGSFPINAARAYGIAPVRTPAPASPAAPLAQLRPADRVDIARPAEPGPNLQALVAGHVREPAFASAPMSSMPPTAPPTIPSPGNGPYQLYTRAADKIEAATAVQMGRAIDVKA